MTRTDWSVPETEVLSGVGDALDAGRDDVLATVIDVEGNAYRRPGAKMLIRDDDTAGSITAGCLEDEVARLGREVRETGDPHVETYDLTGDDDALWGRGMGCNGIITVLLEPITESYRPVVDASAAGEDIGVVTVVDGDRLGERAYYTPEEEFAGGLTDDLRDELAEPTAGLLAEGNSDTIRIETDDGTIEVFVDGIRAPSHLVIFGSGPDVEPVVDLATRVELRVTVVSFRGAHASEERFPEADTVRSSSPTDVRAVVDFDDDTHAVVMTHNFVDDRLVLEELLDTRTPYIGLMGPQERFEELLEEFVEDGVAVAEDDFERIYTPIGLDLGGESPSRIAYSIVGEVLAVANGRTPGHLTEREEPIHDRLDFDVEIAPE